MKNTKVTKRNIYAISFGLLFSFSLIILFYELIINETNPKVLKTKVSHQIQKKQKKSIYLVEKTINLLNKYHNLSWDVLDEQLPKTKNAVVIFKKDSLYYWNSTNWPVNLNIKEGLYQKPRIIFSSDKWYVSYGKRVKKLTVFVFVPLQENDNLHGSFFNFFDDFKSKPQFSFVLNKAPSNNNVFYLKKFNIGIKINKSFRPTVIVFFQYFFYSSFYFFLFLLILYGPYYFRKKAEIKKPSLIWWLITVGFIAVIRVFDTFFIYPTLFNIPGFYFTPQLYFFFVFSSPANLVLNLFLVLLFLWQLKSMIISLEQKVSYKNIYKIFVYLFLVISIIFSVAVLLMADQFLTAYDEKISGIYILFNFLGFLELLFVVLITLIIYFLFDINLILFNLFKIKKVFFALTIIISLLLLYFCNIENEIILLTSFLFVGLCIISIIFDYKLNIYLYYLFVVLILSFSGAFIINVTKHELKDAKQKITASLLSRENDPYLEYLLEKLVLKIKKDQFINSIINDSINNSDKNILLKNYLVKKYFKGYFSIYNKQFTLCYYKQKLIIQPGNQIVECDNYFAGMGGKILNNSPGFQIKLLNNEQDYIYYLVKIPLQTTPDFLINLYIEFFSNFLPTDDNSAANETLKSDNILLTKYSFARYDSGKLIYKNGDFMYPAELSYFPFVKKDKFFLFDKYVHYVVKMGFNKVLVVSRPKDTLSVWLLPFSELFLIFGLFLFVFLAIKYGRKAFKLIQFSFRTRLQIVFFATIFTVFIVLSFISLYYFNENNNIRVYSYLREKTHSVQVELQQKINSFDNKRNINNDIIQDYLIKFSNVFFTDINLYNNYGRLVASSRPDIFFNGTHNNLINPKAFEAIKMDHQLFFISKERLGNIIYYSAYAPLVLMNGGKAGIINLPYFARQTDIQQSYYQMLANLLNLLVITGILVIIIIMYLSRFLTKPLEFLQEKINLVGLEKKNEIIKWNKNDEIGRLISAYNQMVRKIERSTELIKFTEREKAWQEMAQQITHEIRNPLTPMKLNVQYLLKAYEQNDPEFNDKIKNITKILEKQIENLNQVAGMFSDFSKKGAGKIEKSDLISAINESISLFQKSFKGDFVLKTSYKKLWIIANHNDLVRVFNNLIKNSIQAMENTLVKKITIEISRGKPDNKFIEVRFSDSGKGISKQEEKKIFQPYFTTKSTGTGLGLAIVNNLIKEWGGEVTFISEINKGTTFILLFKPAE